MGLDLVPLGRPKPGHEVEWAKLMQTLYEGGREREKAAKRREEISIQPYEAIGAPRVGYDAEADAWAIARKDPARRVTDAELIEHMHGYYVVELMAGKCDGVPRYTHGGLYDGVDETSFRGKFLEPCQDLLGEDLLSEAWTEVMRPEEAVAYGKRLLDVAERAAAANGIGASSAQPAPPPPRAEDGEDEPLTYDFSLAEKVDILRSAGRWYIYWGERGHPISAWF
jgi:hypothetical protein